jgi:ADP-heptose:LPS heptosyltransferase
LQSIPANELANKILNACLRDGTWPVRALDALIDRALDEEDPLLATAATRALFRIVVERLGDLFEPTLCDVYARLFSYVISRALPEYQAADLVVRYRRIRQIRKFLGGAVQNVFVLSRVTLGADIAVTSVVLAAAKQRFPEARIYFVGPAKNAELFAADEGITPVPLAYGRSTVLRERLLAASELEAIVEEPEAIVIDPDSRLTQLGLLPICDDSRYYFFESRAFGGNTDSPLPDLTAQWLSEVFDIDRFQPYLAPVQQPRIADITVSFGVGENADKRIGGDFEYEVLRALLRYDVPVLIDRGAGGEEASRVSALVERLGSPRRLILHDGSYASFASHIMQSKLYVGYDSAGQHVANAAGVPLVSAFTGYACERMLARWRPSSSKAHAIALSGNDHCCAIERTIAAIDRTWAEAAAEAAQRDRP